MSKPLPAESLNIPLWWNFNYCIIIHIEIVTLATTFSFTVNMQTIDLGSKLWIGLSHNVSSTTLSVSDTFDGI